MTQTKETKKEKADRFLRWVYKWSKNTVEWSPKNLTVRRVIMGGFVFLVLLSFLGLI